MSKLTTEKKQPRHSSSVSVAALKALTQMFSVYLRGCSLSRSDRCVARLKLILFITSYEALDFPYHIS